MKLRRLFTLLAAAVLAACGKPVVDTSSPDALVDSVAKMRRSLEPEELARFDDAFNELTNGALLAGNPESLRLQVQECTAVSHMDAEQIVRTAWTNRVTRIRSRIDELQRQHDGSAEARAVVARMEVEKATFFPVSKDFVERPILEVALDNRTRRRVFKVTFQASLRRSDVLEPLVVELVDRPFGTGLAPGKRTTVRVELEEYEWRRHTSTEEGVIFSCCVMALEARRGRTIARSDFGAAEENLLDALGKRLTELEANNPFERLQ